MPLTEPRRTRDEIIRLDAIATVAQRTSSGVVWTLAIVLGMGALAGAGMFALMVQSWPRDWRWLAFGAGFGVLISLTVTLTVAYKSFADWIDLQRERVRNRPASLPDFYQTGERTHRRVDEPPFDDERRLRDCRRWFVAIHYADATLSQDGTADVDGGLAYGLDRDEVNAAKAWAIERGWYRWVSRANSTGEWTALGKLALERLAGGASWEQVLTLRQSDLDQSPD